LSGKPQSKFVGDSYIGKKNNRFVGNINIPEATSVTTHRSRDGPRAPHLRYGEQPLPYTQRPEENHRVAYDTPTTWHKLVGPTGVWMTDLPCEQAQHDGLLKNVRDGHVLIGGLGLGLARASAPRINQSPRSRSR